MCAQGGKDGDRGATIHGDLLPSGVSSACEFGAASGDSGAPRRGRDKPQLRQDSGDDSGTDGGVGTSAGAGDGSDEREETAHLVLD